MNDKKPNLDLAYALETVQDNRELYASWATDYDKDFASSMDYILPNQVAQIFLNLGGIGPVLDVGAGTGLGGQALAKLGIDPIDALDLSDEMLEIAAKKKIYRSLFTSDITQRIETSNYLYQGVISSGTFTHGHVGPNAIDNLLSVASTGALFALSQIVLAVCQVANHHLQQQLNRHHGEGGNQALVPYLFPFHLSITKYPHQRHAPARYASSSALVGIPLCPSSARHESPATIFAICTDSSIGLFHT